jgi:hypothetical protein
VSQAWVNALIAAGTVLLVLAAVLLIVDRWVRPLPTVRKYRDALLKGLGAVATVLLALATFGLLRKKKPEPKEPEPVEPEEFDDAKAIENEKAALDTDAQPDADAAVDAVIGDILSERSGEHNED